MTLRARWFFWLQGASVAAYTLEVSADGARTFRFAAETSESHATVAGLAAGELRERT